MMANANVRCRIECHELREKMEDNEYISERLAKAEAVLKATRAELLRRDARISELLDRDTQGAAPVCGTLLAKRRLEDKVGFMEREKAEIGEGWEEIVAGRDKRIGELEATARERDALIERAKVERVEAQHERDEALCAGRRLQGQIDDLLEEQAHVGGDDDSALLDWADEHSRWVCSGSTPGNWVRADTLRDVLRKAMNDEDGEEECPVRVPQDLLDARKHNHNLRQQVAERDATIADYRRELRKAKSDLDSERLMPSAPGPTFAEWTKEREEINAHWAEHDETIAELGIDIAGLRAIIGETDAILRRVAEKEKTAPVTLQGMAQWVVDALACQRAEITRLIAARKVAKDTEIVKLKRRLTTMGQQNRDLRMDLAAAKS